MTAAIWFGLAAIALVGAIVLLYFDRVQRQRTGHVRQVWAKSQGYTYVSVEPSLASTWRRGAMAKLGYLSAIDVVSGNRKGEKFVLFDLEDAATLVAVRRQIGSDIDIDLRLKTAAPPKDVDLELLGAIGDRVVFATNPDIARHAVDQRMVHFIETLPHTVQQLWSEGNWTLGLLPVGTTAKEWETAIDAVLRLSGLLHVLPPITGGERFLDETSVPVRRDEGDRYDDDPRFDDREPVRERFDDGDDFAFGASDVRDDRRADDFRDDRGADDFDARFQDDRFEDDRFDDDRFDDDFEGGNRFEDDARFDGVRFDDDHRESPRFEDDDFEPAFGDDARRADDPTGPDVHDDRELSDRPDRDDDGRGPDTARAADTTDRESGVIGGSLVSDIAGEPEPKPSRRPALAVVPDPRNRVRRNWPPAEEYVEDDEPEAVADDLDRPRDEDETPQRPGGPFHPGFRPYQGPAPR
ncbi:hypothetical protein [Nocardia vermiculata]|uniref:hypothetical protein n=1 Tax=Nocardia vermiculata TaxID=257274 RepID=UPI000833E3FC|nr:hypothetical protein [Nocardia vermiculata]